VPAEDMFTRTGRIGGNVETSGMTYTNDSRNHINGQSRPQNQRHPPADNIPGSVTEAIFVRLKRLVSNVMIWSIRPAPCACD